MSNQQETQNEIKELICKNFMYNRCDRGDSCKYIHNSKLCFYFWKHANCKFGDDCKKSHDFKSQESKSQESKSQESKSQESKSQESKSQESKSQESKSQESKSQESKSYKRPIRKRNTECFEPMIKPVDLRIVLDSRSVRCGTMYDDISELTSRDVLLSPKLFDDFGKYEIYNNLVSEIENCGIPKEQLLKMWHGNNVIEGTHLIVDDHRKWKETCPTFNMVISRLKDVFKMDIKATRLNWYRDPDHWKPFHKDSSAINPDRALTQNFTVAVSFGVTKDAAFEHAKTKTVISMPQPDGTIYSFTNDTNCIWRHGILQDKNPQELGRISVIAWGWIDNVKS
jgi:hypothetical protein